jgi:hypothetical protein
MEDENELYSKDDLLAFQRVGEFLCWFSMVESKIDESIIRLLGIEAVAGRLLLAYVPFAKKCEFFREMISVSEGAFADDERKQAVSKVNNIINFANTKRNIIAHSQFVAYEGGVKFLKAEKKMRDDTSRLFDAETFRACRTQMLEFWESVTQITHRIQVKMNQKQIAESLGKRLADEIAEPFSKLH